jgi:hypothetical protein
MAFEPWCNVDMLYTTDKTDADWDKKISCSMAWRANMAGKKIYKNIIIVYNYKHPA